MKRTHIFEADDGTTFDTAAECKRHEEIVRLCDILSLARSTLDIRGRMQQPRPMDPRET